MKQAVHSRDLQCFGYDQVLRIAKQCSQQCLHIHTTFITSIAILNYISVIFEK